MRVPEAQINATSLLNAQKARQATVAEETRKATTTTKTQASAIATYSASPGDSSSISGHALLMSRVLHAADPKVEPPVITEFNDSTRKLPAAQFLTSDDRIMVAKVFEYAQAQGADLGYVDQLAGTLGQYRKSDNGQQMSMIDIASIPGQKKKYAFTDTDKATIQQILNSEAFKSTELDADFIRHATDDKHANIKHTDFKFLEQIVTRFSAQGDKAEPMGNRFNRYSGPRDYKQKPVTAADLPSKSQGKEVVRSDPTRKWGAPATLSTPTLEHIYRTIGKVFGRNAHPSLFEFLSERIKR